MPLGLEDLRLAICGSLASTGRAPDTATLAASSGADADVIEGGLRQLAAARHPVLDSGGRIVLAHPFSTVDLGFSVKGGRALWWGDCIWDAGGEERRSTVAYCTPGAPSPRIVRGQPATLEPSDASAAILPFDSPYQALM